MRKLSIVLPFLGILFYSIAGLPASTSTDYSNNYSQSKKATIQHPIRQLHGPLDYREKQESKIPNFFGVAFYKPTFILPYYYTGSPDNKVYYHNTPTNEQLRHSEVKYQFSLKVPAWQNIMHRPSTLYLAYTQLSYWQLYNRRAFIRENDYEPEVFLANQVNWHLYKNWNMNFLNAGFVHQSNGFGNTLERSWNRIYLEAITSVNNWVISIKPWYIISENKNNTNINKFLGYGRILVAYKLNQQVFSLQAHNIIEGGARYATAEATWSFPMTRFLKGYVQGFSGYGQSLIEYNHRTNSIGLGIALNDWV